MKRFLSKTFFFSLCVALLHIVFCIGMDPCKVINPYGVHSLQGVDEYYVKMYYIVNNPDRFDAFIFGSSRVGSIHPENIGGFHCYNMSMPSGIPQDHLRNIKTMTENGIIPKRIFVGVDSLSFANQNLRRNSSALTASYEFSKENPIGFWKLYFDPAVIEKTVAVQMESKLYQKLHGKKDKDYSLIYYNYGWYYDYSGEYREVDIYSKVGVGSKEYIDITLDTLGEIVQICKDYDIELFLFTNPMCYGTYEASLEENYLDFLHQLSRITPYYNFSGYSDIACDASWWNDESHCFAEVGDLMIDAMCNGKCPEDLYAQGFGWYVTEDNVDELLALPEMSGAAVNK